MDKIIERKINTFILRWNPAISSFKMEHYRDAIRKYPYGWCSNWSVFEHENAHEDDFFFMIRVGKGNTGVVFRGEFISEPYEGDDWAGTDRKRYYVDIACSDFSDPDEPALITAAELYEAIPEIDWMHGHSGVMLSYEQAEKLYRLWGEKVGYDDEEDDDEFEDFTDYDIFDPH